MHVLRRRRMPGQLSGLYSALYTSPEKVPAHRLESTEATLAEPTPAIRREADGSFSQENIQQGLEHRHQVSCVPIMGRGGIMAKGNNAQSKDKKKAKAAPKKGAKPAPKPPTTKKG